MMKRILILTTAALLFAAVLPAQTDREVFPVVSPNFPPPPPPPPNYEMDVFKVVDQMPRFPGCEDLTTEEEKKTCSQKELLDFIYTNLNYPALAIENEMEGTTVVTFIIEKDGTLSDIKVIRDIGGGCGDEAARVMALMNERGIRWTPGIQQGDKVRVRYNVPIRFKLS